MDNADLLSRAIKNTLDQRAKEARLVIMPQGCRHVTVTGPIDQFCSQAFEINPLRQEVKSFYCDGITHQFQVVNAFPFCWHIVIYPYTAIYVVDENGLMSSMDPTLFPCAHHYNNLTPTEQLLFNQYAPDFS